MTEDDRQEANHEESRPTAGHGHAHGETGHDGHAHHDEHEDHAGHDHGGHDDHDDHAGHDHDAHDHHAEHDHDGHDHHEGDDDHAGHDHSAHDHHDDHAGHGHGGHDHSGHGHGHHDHAHDLRGASKRSLIIALALISTYMVAEVIGGIMSGSLALLADAGHMLTDAAAIMMALVAMWIAQKEASVESTFGYHRTEILAALANTFALWLIAGWIVFEAYHRLFREDVEVVGLPVLIVGIGGFLINLAAAWVLHRSSGESLNVEGAFQHVIADLLGSVGVIVSAILIMAFEWHLADPILSVVIALLILYNTRRLIVSILNVLLQGTPEHIDLYKLCSDLEEMEGVTLIHDVHIWTLTSSNEVFTAHILMDPSYTGDIDQLITRMQDLLHDNYEIEHVTLQLEKSVEGCTEDHHVGHLLALSR